MQLRHMTAGCARHEEEGIRHSFHGLGLRPYHGRGMGASSAATSTGAAAQPHGRSDGEHSRRGPRVRRQRQPGRRRTSGADLAASSPRRPQRAAVHRRRAASPAPAPKPNQPQKTAPLGSAPPGTMEHDMLKLFASPCRPAAWGRCPDTGHRSRYGGVNAVTPKCF